MNIGPYTVNWINFKLFKLDGGAMFGVVPKPIWDRLIPGDEKNRITLSLWGLVLRSEERTILVDSGIWGGFNPKLADIYGVGFKPAPDGNLDHLDPESVTDLVLTHLHFDHAGGAIDSETGAPAFPNARYYTSRTQLDWARSPSLRDRASYVPALTEGVAGHERLITYRGALELDEHLTILEVSGHSPGMSLLKASDRRTTLLHAADMVPTSHHVPLPYVMAYDLDPVETVDARQRFYERAASEGWHLFFQHDPDHPLWTIKRDEKGRYARGEPIR